MTRYLKTIKDRLKNPLFIFYAFIILCSHDLYLKMDHYFLNPQDDGVISLYNGTFERSENLITRDRMLDASVISHGKRENIPSTQWQDQDSTITQLPFTAGDAGTYVVGVSTKARNIELKAERFNNYLKHDGVLDMLDYRTKNNQLDQDAVESYEKHVKAIYQVGDVKTDEWQTVLGYPIEFIPLDNPYNTFTGDSLNVKLLLDGAPLADQLVYADYVQSGHHHTHNEHDHDHDHDHSHEHTGDSGENHTHTSGQKMRTDKNGIVTMQLPEDGIYYVRTIFMENIADHDTLTHRSKWATLTFQVSHAHNEETHEHHEGLGIPTWVFIIGSVGIIGVFFLFFKRQQA